MKLNDKVATLKGVGPKSLKKLNQIGIYTLKDLLFYFPRSWKDYSDTQNLAKLRIGTGAIVKVKIDKISTQKIYKKHLTITRATIVDDQQNNMQAIWFNQPFIENIVKPGSNWIIEGKVGFDFQKKIKSLTVVNYEKKAKIFAIYPETEGVTSKYLSKLVKQVLDKTKLIRDSLSQKIIKKFNLHDLDYSLRKIHFPKDASELEIAKNNLALRELLVIAYTQLKRRKKYHSFLAYALNVRKKDILEFEKLFPFELTLAQKKAVYEISSDLKKPIGATRLINGDVGSGKTAVALSAIYLTLKNKLRSAWLVPTEILAWQHFEKINKYLNKHPEIKISLITSNKIINRKKQEISKKQALSADIIIGTHAIIQKDIKIDNLALVIVDEEHRFGVKQRAKLVTLNSKNIIPHYLSLTATPIPRTLAISLYGDLDISIIDSLPTGRKKIITKVIANQFRDKTYNFIKKHLDMGRQIYVICPLIESTNSKNSLFALEQKSVINEYQKLKKIFSDYKISLLHGKLESAKKNSIMDKFHKNKINILVSTSVIEVGIDVPNANIVLIEDADRFGLAQLHQFRGRVGRGKTQSFCLMFTNNTSMETKKRLISMEQNTDGFKLSEIDLKFRGPGDLIAFKQSGYNRLKIAKITDTILLSKTRQIANYLVNHNINYVF